MPSGKHKFICIHYPMAKDAGHRKLVYGNGFYVTKNGKILTEEQHKKRQHRKRSVKDALFFISVYALLVWIGYLYYF